MTHIIFYQSLDGSWGTLAKLEAESRKTRLQQAGKTVLCCLPVTSRETAESLRKEQEILLSEKVEAVYV